MTKTLLEQAKEVKLNRQDKKEVTKDEFNLAMAYMRGEVTNKQVGTVIGDITNTFTFVGRCLMGGIRNKWLIEKK